MIRGPPLNWALLHLHPAPKGGAIKPIHDKVMLCPLMNDKEKIVSIFKSEKKTKKL